MRGAFYFNKYCCYLLTFVVCPFILLGMTDTKDTQEEWLSVNDVAILFGISTQGVRRWIDNGLKYKIKKVIGRRPFKVMSRLDVENYIAVGIREDD